MNKKLFNENNAKFKYNQIEIFFDRELKSKIWTSKTDVKQIYIAKEIQIKKINEYNNYNFDIRTIFYNVNLNTEESVLVYNISTVFYYKKHFLNTFKEL